MDFEDEAPSGKPGIAHISLFHDEFFISSTLSNQNAQIIYSYLVGCSEAIREDRRMKCFSFKDISKNMQIIYKTDDDKLENKGNQNESKD